MYDLEEILGISKLKNVCHTYALIVKTVEKNLSRLQIHASTITHIRAVPAMSSMAKLKKNSETGQLCLTPLLG